MKGKMLDYALSKGFYRMQQRVFSTNKIFHPEGVYDVFWLRTILDKDISLIQKHKIYKLNKNFTVKISNARITKEIESLFQLYKNHVTIDVADSVKEYLKGNNRRNNFTSRMVQVRDNKKLIAVGYFDLGNKSIMGIMNIYHPEYKKYSPGKYLMLRKMQYAIEAGMRYYYTGYIGIQVPYFDYKVFPDPSKVEVRISSWGSWEPFSNYGKEGLKAFIEDESLNFM